MSNADALALATRQGQCGRCAQVFHAQLLQQRREALFDLRPAQRLAVIAPLQLQHGAQFAVEPIDDRWRRAFGARNAQP